MTFQYIFGSDQEEVSSYIVSDVFATGVLAGRRLIIIVPEQFSLEMERLFLSKNQKALSSIQILSFERLAYWVLASEGFFEGQLMDDMGKFMLLSKAVEKVKKKLKIYKNTPLSVGFLEELAYQMDEFTKYCVTPSHLEILKEKLLLSSQDQHFKSKLEEVGIIFDAYNDLKERLYTTQEEMLTMLAEKVSTCPFLQGTSIWFDRFNGFTPQEYEVIEKLMQVANISVALMGADEKSYIFRSIEKTVETLNTLATKEHMTLLPRKIVSGKREKLETLDHLQKNWLSTTPTTYTSETDTIVLIENKHKYEEISQVASNILKLTKQGYTYQQIAIIVADSSYYPIIENTFDTYDIPVFIDRVEDIFFHPLVKLVEGMFQVIMTNRSYKSVMQVVKTGLLSLSLEEIHRIENYILAFGIYGQKWNIAYEDMEGNKEKEDAINRNREKVVSILEIIEKIPKKAKGLSMAKAAVMAIKELEVEKTIDKWLEETEKNDMKLFQVHEQMWPKVMEVFQKIGDLMPEEEMKIETFATIVKAGFEASSLGLLPPTLDQVMVGDFRRSRLRDISVLFIVGANEDKLPPKFSNKGLFLDAEKEEARQLGIELGESIDTKYDDFELFFYQNLIKPTHKLCISYCQMDIDGTQLQKSSYVDRINMMFPAVKTVSSKDFFPLKPKPLFSEITKAMSSDVMDDRKKEALSYFLQEKTYKEKLDKIEKALFEPEERLYLKTPRLSKQFSSSVSRLETFAACPFQYFATYDLRLRKREVLDVHVADVGNIYHGVLDSFASMILDTKKPWQDISSNTIKGFALKAIEMETKKKVNQVLETSFRFQYFKDKIFDISTNAMSVLTEHMLEGKFQLYGSEEVFSKELNNALAIPLSEGQMFVEGKIDRVDVFENEGVLYVKLIDYKSGAHTMDIRKIYLGVQLQLLIYMQALIQAFENNTSLDMTKVLPGAVLYFRVHEPTVKESGKDMDLSEEMKKKHRMDGWVLKEEDVVFALDTSLEEINKTSLIAPISTIHNKGSDKKEKPFTLGAGEKMVSEKEFLRFMEFAEEKAQDLGEELIQGLIEKSPYRLQNERPCRYCVYQSVCKFDPLLDRNKENVYTLSAKETKNKILTPQTENNEK